MCFCKRKKRDAEHAEDEAILTMPAIESRLQGSATEPYYHGSAGENFDFDGARLEPESAKNLAKKTALQANPDFALVQNFAQLGMRQLIKHYVEVEKRWDHEKREAHFHFTDRDIEYTTDVYCARMSNEDLMLWLCHCNDFFEEYLRISQADAVIMTQEVRSYFEKGGTQRNNKLVILKEGPWSDPEAPDGVELFKWNTDGDLSSEIFDSSEVPKPKTIHGVVCPPMEPSPLYKNECSWERPIYAPAQPLSILRMVRMIRKKVANPQKGGAVVTHGDSKCFALLAGVDFLDRTFNPNIFAGPKTVKPPFDLNNELIDKVFEKVYCPIRFNKNVTFYLFYHLAAIELIVEKYGLETVEMKKFRQDYPLFLTALDKNQEKLKAKNEAKLDVLRKKNQEICKRNIKIVRKQLEKYPDNKNLLNLLASYENDCWN